MDKKEIHGLLDLPLLELVSLANKVRSEHAGSKIELCSIMNAKSGLCAEDCKFCAQSSRHKTWIATYPLKSKQEMLQMALRAKEIGAHRFDIVTSGDKLSEKELELIAETILQITKEVGIAMCASLGNMDKDDFLFLKQSGLSRYHHNLETSRNFFPKIVTTHSYEDRIGTIRAAKACGLEVCSGGIIGLGETFADRIDLALLLKELDVDSVPVNVLVPVKGTALGEVNKISALDAVRTIALFRIILQDKIIKIAAGRESILKDFQSLVFMAGATGMLIGGYLTIKGRSVEEDQRLVEEVTELWKS